MTRTLPLLALVLAACKGSTVCLDMSGDWLLEVTDVDSSCGPEDDWSSELEVVQAGCEATDIDVSGIKGDPTAVTGSVDGEQIAISGSFDDSGGVTELTFDLSRDSDTAFSGTEDWEWFASPDDPQPTCADGTANVSLTRQ